MKFFSFFSFCALVLFKLICFLLPIVFPIFESSIRINHPHRIIMDNLFIVEGSFLEGDFLATRILLYLLFPLSKFSSYFHLHFPSFSNNFQIPFELIIHTELLWITVYLSLWVAFWRFYSNENSFCIYFSFCREILLLFLFLYPSFI